MLEDSRAVLNNIEQENIEVTLQIWGFVTIFCQNQSKSLTEEVESLKREVKKKESVIDKLESEYDVMNETIGSYLSHRESQGNDTERRKTSKSEPRSDKDSLVFHGVQVHQKYCMLYIVNQIG